MYSCENYQAHLARVSRSFAFCIEQLREPLREWVGLSYLLCRVLDCVEDAPWPGLKQQRAAYAGFFGFLELAPSEQQFALWSGQFPDGLSPGEKALIADGRSLFVHLHGLPGGIGSQLRQCLVNMARGMEHFSHQGAGRGLRLEELAEINKYCFFVAGVVGELLTNLVHFRRDGGALLATHPKNKRALQLGDAVHFGLFLQKINLLKDQVADEQAGRFLVGEKTALLASMREHGLRALRYLQNWPTVDRDFRLFCGWSYFLGLASLEKIKLGWSENRPVKISRGETLELLGEVSVRIDNNEQLEELAAGYPLVFSADRAEVEVAGAHHAPASRAVAPWWLGLYEGEIEACELSALTTF